MQRIKEVLAKKAIAVEKRDIYSALTVADASTFRKLEHGEIYPPKK
jgi:hypothetical protein